MGSGSRRDSSACLHQGHKGSVAGIPLERLFSSDSSIALRIPEIKIALESETNDLKVVAERPAFRVTAEGNLDIEKLPQDGAKQE